MRETFPATGMPDLGQAEATSLVATRMGEAQAVGPASPVPAGTSAGSGTGSGSAP